MIINGLRLSPAYDLLNSRIHIEDSDFALEDGLLPKNLAQGTIGMQFFTLAEKAELNEKQTRKIVESFRGNCERVEQLIQASFLNEKTKRNYQQSYHSKLKRISKKRIIDTNINVLIIIQTIYTLLRTVSKF